jgi:hypothetical protein
VSRKYERRYTKGALVAHLLSPWQVDGVDDQTPALCGQQPAWWWHWYGSGSQDEYDRAAALRVCGLCRAMADETSL